MTRSGRIVLLALALVLPCPGRLLAQTTPPAEAPQASQPKTPTTSEVKLSQAERILRLEQTIEAGTKECTELKTWLNDPNSEYGKAKADFLRIDKRLKEREKELTTQPAPAGTDPLEGLKKVRELAKQRFDLAVKEAATIREKCTAVENKLKLDQETLAKLRGVTASQPADTATPPAGTGQPPAVAPPPAANGAQGSAGQPEPPAPAIKIPGLPSVTAPGASAQPAPGSNGAAPSTSTTDDEENKELIAAQATAKDTQAQAATVEQDLQLIQARVASLRKAKETELKLRDTAKERAKVANQSYNGRREYMQKLVSTGAPSEKINEIWERVEEAEKLATKAEEDVNRRTAKIEELTAQLDDLRTEEEDARSRADKARTTARDAQSNVRRLENPFSVYNITQWLLIHGPRMVGILIGMGALLWFTAVFEERIIKFIARSDDQSTQRERESRARTLASVFRNFGSTVVICGGILMLLTEVKINIVPLLGGAAVFGLAVAFGAQSLIKDYFYGFMILLENQYAINDVIRIGDASGTVERITLRMTVLRGEDGAAHFIPHGEIHKVTNMTHGWSRAVFEIGVGYGEDTDRVMEVLIELGRHMRREPAFSRHILEDPEMWGVNQLGDSAVIIKFAIKTRPLQQWSIKREMLRRIKKRFDELGIEIPFPHQVVYNRTEPRPATADSADGNGTTDAHKSAKGVG